MIDERAFTQAAQEQLAGLYRLSLSILHTASDAQDAVQQGMLRAWEKRTQVNDPQKLRAWMTRIVINECRNIQRKRMRIFPVADISKWTEQSGEVENNDLADAMAELPEKLRMPLLLRYMEGFAEKEIAHALGISTATVKSRLHRARKALRSELEDAEVRFS